MTNQFFIHVDILGFYALPREIAQSSGGDEEFIREKYLKEPLLEKLSQLETKIYDMTIAHRGTDNFLLTCNSLNSLFEMLEELTQVKIPNNSFDNIPLEVAIDYREISETDVDITNKSSTIIFLKTNLVADYKQKSSASLRKTFALLTESVYNKLEQPDKTFCTKLETNDMEFFSINPDIFLQKQKIRKFLESIKRPDNKLYNRIDTLFVPPKEFDEIKNTLHHKRIVFITGTKEFGKTYTAIRLLWDFYNLGYSPKWIGGEENEQMQITRDKLIRIEEELQSKHIIYFEDPFGRTKYEATETLEREIKMIIRSIENVEDVFVIITSREEVFKEFLKEKLSGIDLKQFERKLNIKKPSYEPWSRRELLRLYAETKDCMWRHHYVAKRVFEEVEANNVLPTPLSIRSFAIDSKNDFTHESIWPHLEEASKETAQSFAKEIRSMDKSQKLFLAILFVSRWGMNLTTIKKLYHDLCTKIHMENPTGFEDILTWFQDDKIEYAKEHISFSHPSYYEALGYVLSDTEKHTELDGDLFANVLLFMAEHGFNLDFVADSITSNYKRLPINLRDKLLEKISSSEMPTVKFYLATCVEKNFDELPIQLCETLISHVSDMPSAAKVLASVIISKKESVDESLRQTTLLKYCHLLDAVEVIAFHLLQSLDKFTPELYDKILQHVHQGGLGHVTFGWHIDHYYKKLDEEAQYEFLTRLSNSEYYRGEAGKTLLLNLKPNTPKRHVELLYLLASSENSSYSIASHLDIAFENISAEILTKVLQLLSKHDKDDTVSAVCKFLHRNFQNLDQSLIVSIMSEIKDKKPAPGYLAGLILKNYNDLDQNIRDLIFEFVSIKEYKNEILFIIGQHYPSLPEEVQALLEKYNKEFFEFLQRLSAGKNADIKSHVLDVLTNIAGKYKEIELKILTLLANDPDEEIKNRATYLLDSLNN